MASSTSIVNVALRKIGGGRITSLTDGSKNANAASDIYSDLLEVLLRNHFWNFAIVRVKLARQTTAPAFGYLYGYAIPSDWLRTVTVHDNEAGVGTFDYRAETNADVKAILTDAEDVYLRYVRSVTDPNLMPPDFREAFSCALARDLAIPVADSNTLQQSMKGDTQLAMAVAKGADAMDSPPEPRPVGSWVTARRGGGRWARR